jgi:hypothetical protein
VPLLYIADYMNFRVAIFTIFGRFVGCYGRDPQTLRRVMFDRPTSLAVNGGYVFIGDSSNHSMCVLTKNFLPVCDFGTSREKDPFYISLLTDVKLFSLTKQQLLASSSSSSSSSSTSSSSVASSSQLCLVDNTANTVKLFNFA